MSALGALGLEPAPEDEVTPVEEEAPVEEEIVVPEGAENPDAVKAAIKAERTRAREANARARDLERQLRERDDADKPLEERIAAAEASVAAADLKALKLEVALSKGLSMNLVPRLVGSTKEELEADADVLVSELGTTTKAPLDGGYKPPPPKAKEDPAKAHNAFITGLLQGTRQQ